MNPFYIIHGFSLKQACSCCGALHETEIEHDVEADRASLARELAIAGEEAGSFCPACRVQPLPAAVAA
ncbi:hypothetical protein [Luteolibacter sp. LG18]|uniref:hypothetical protein n=1 Tax=Luteolibacter sp. LG18 TaxID=2819286 RepID=UPI002B2ACCC1|nr:hypothetical protein llg_41400 [Luteolibacter sp. LG18]